MKGSLTRLVILGILLSISFAYCSKPANKETYKNIGGYVIGKETCNSDVEKDNWLLDFTVYPNSPKIGDTLLYNGITYTNVLKVATLDPRLKIIGYKVSIDYRFISDDKDPTVGCNISMPNTFRLRTLDIINQFEIR